MSYSHDMPVSSEPVWPSTDANIHITTQKDRGSWMPADICEPRFIC
ncbi:hypothetical protein DVU_1659 [Nitratidesulfovibrio vulgaris str. Hildenborough]|uniref:Uncharacterized protein n=1 Tax=Nitratidesulfovibrio vulgaris (strain ATCC 29579 / DSM 644 / CCUG 34227 / NCIMB 8303 / VKM B-1760 / Hildenborough) TaxID=882 RepID=Q72BH7_NITV2|nr:hypothetical protein DVU_1659 [Nitratidesulfovibrio vulgaris str. Hildenborough]